MNINLKLFFIIFFILYSTSISSAGVEVAQGKTSSADAFFVGYPASNANDGITTNYWIRQGSGVTYPSWWMVDLGSLYNIDTIRMIYYNDRKYNLNISVSTDDITYVEVYANTSYYTGVNDVWLPNITITPTLARYVKINLVNDVDGSPSSAMLEEVQIYGTALNSPSITTKWNNYTSDYSENITITGQSVPISFNITTNQTITSYYWSVDGLGQGVNSSIFNTTIYEGNHTVVVYGSNLNGSTNTTTWYTFSAASDFLSLTVSGDDVILKNKYWTIVSNNTRVNISSIKMDELGVSQKELLKRNAYIDIGDGISYLSNQTAVTTTLTKIYNGTSSRTLAYHMTYRTDIWFNITLKNNDSMFYITSDMIKGGYSIGNYIFIVPVDNKSELNGEKTKYLNFGSFAGFKYVMEYFYPSQYAIYKEANNSKSWEAFSNNGSMSAMYQENRSLYTNFLYEFEWYDVPYSKMSYNLNFRPMISESYIDNTTKNINTINGNLNILFNSLVVGVKERYQTSKTGKKYIPYRDGKNYRGMFPHDTYHMGTAASWENISAPYDIVNMWLDNLRSDGRVLYATNANSPFTEDWGTSWSSGADGDDCGGVQNSMVIINAYDYVVASNNTTWINSYWSKISKATHYYDTYYNSSYTMLYYSGGQKGWAEQNNLNGFATEINVLYVRALDGYAMMALKAGNTTEYTWAWNRRNSVINSINKYLWLDYSSAYNVTGLRANTTTGTFDYYINNSFNSTNMSYSTAIYSVPGSSNFGGMVFRWLNNTNYYFIDSAPSLQSIKLRKRVSGTYSDITGWTIIPGYRGLNNFTINDTNNTIKIYANGALIINVTSSNLVGGKAGYWVLDQDSVFVNFFAVSNSSATYYEDFSINNSIGWSKYNQEGTTSNQIWYWQQSLYIPPYGGYYKQQMNSDLTYPTTRFYTLGNIQMVNFGYSDAEKKTNIHDYIINSTGVVGQEIIRWGGLSGWLSNSDLQFSDSDYGFVKKQTNFFVNALDAPEFLARTNETLFNEFVNSSYMTEDIHGTSETTYDGLAVIETTTGQYRRGGVMSYQANGFGLLSAIERGVFGIKRQMYGLVVHPDHKISSFYNTNNSIIVPYLNHKYNITMNGNGTSYQYTLNNKPYYADKMPINNSSGTSTVYVKRINIENLTNIVLVDIPEPIYVINVTKVGSVYNYTLEIPSGNYNLTFNVPSTYNLSSVILYDGIQTSNWTYSNSVITLNITGGSEHTVTIMESNDTTPPESITNLSNTTTSNSINWTWTNPPDLDFSYTSIYLDGVLTLNISDTFLNYSGLVSGTSYTISTHTVDTSGNVNTTWVNQTTVTDSAPTPTPTPTPSTPSSLDRFKSAQESTYSIFTTSLTIFSLIFMVLGISIIILTLRGGNPSIILVGVIITIIGFSMMLIGSYIISAISSSLIFK